MEMIPEVDEYIEKNEAWQEELRALRAIALDCQLAETLKWRVPCYTFQGKNVIMLGRFKEYCALSFMKGALLKDSQKILELPGENTRSGRVIRFTTAQKIAEMAPILTAYIEEAVAVEIAGLKVDFSENRNLDYPEELQARLDELPALEKAFDALTPGRKRAYVMHFAAAKQSTTRASRVEKFMPRILDGKGLNDCTCGHSKKMPQCDGSHKNFR
tara:strand:+ start:479 stop:1123 length:645 start_codon:yes stop_codon:yes gene_type:complete